MTSSYYLNHDTNSKRRKSCLCTHWFKRGVVGALGLMNLVSPLGRYDLVRMLPAEQEMAAPKTIVQSEGSDRVKSAWAGTKSVEHGAWKRISWTHVRERVM